MSTPNRKPNPDEVITAKEIAFKYKICLSKAYILMHGSGKAFHLDRSIRMFAKDFDHFIKEKNTTSNSAKSILDKLE